MILRAGLALFLSVPAFAATVSEDFTTRANYAPQVAVPDRAVWNQALGVLHPSLRLVNYKTGYVAADALAIDVGDGADGPFRPDTYAGFSVGGDLSGNVIRLDTDAHPELHVTTFVLESGWTLRPVGSRPLVVRSLDSILVRGTIDCAGGSGGAGGVSAGVGGVARCGGHAGGTGGGVAIAGADGAGPSSLVTAGRGGPYSGSAAGGGGGGAWNASLPAADGVGNASSAGLSYDDALFEHVDGGAGGGGGSGSATDAGGGGGAGGGVVRLFAAGDLELGTAPASVDGFIFVNGGAGGGGVVGGGGGGGGGSVQAFVGGAIEIYNTDPDAAAQATPGAGGLNGGTTVGGVGSVGRTWFSSVRYNQVGTGYYTPSEQPPVISGNNVEFSTSRQMVVTRVFDLGGSRPRLDGLALDPSSAEFGVEYAGSDDAFVGDDTGWAILPPAGKRYVRLRLSVTSADPSSPARLEGFSFAYDPGRREDFDFRAAGCGRVARGSTPGAFLLLLVFLFMLSIRIRAARMRRFRAN